MVDTGADVEGRTGLDPAPRRSRGNLIADTGGEAIAAVGDIAQLEFAESTVQTALDTYGDLDIVVCAHGILREAMVFNMSEGDWDEVLRVHLKGCFAITKFAAIYWRANREKGNRRLIYFSSSAGIRGEGGQPNYSAAHAAKIGAQPLQRRGAGRLWRHLQLHLTGRLHPHDRPRPQRRPWGGAAQPLRGRPPAWDPNNVVPAIVYLASDESAELTGRTVGVTGHTVSIWKEPEWVAAIYSETPYWDIDSLFEVMPRTLVATGVGPPPRQFP